MSGAGGPTTVVLRSAYGGRNGFAHVASALSRAARVARIILVEEDPSNLVARLSESGRRVIVFYGVSTPLYLELAGEIERVSRIAPVVVGGPHASGAYWQVLRLGAVAAVVGDGEAAAPAIVESLSNDAAEWPPPNTAVYTGSSFRVGRTVLIDLDDYDPHYPQLGLYPPIEIMRGCSFRCRFCQVPWEFKSSVRFRGVESVARATVEYVRAGRRDIRFVAPIGLAYGSEDLKTPNPSALEELLRAVRDRGGRPYLGTFPSETRPEFVTPEVLRVLKRLAHNRRISIGMQSGSDELLRFVGRGHGVEEAMEAAATAVEFGFTPVVDLIFGMPGESEGDVEKTVEAMFKLASMGARLRLHSFLPLVGTPLARSRPKPIHPLYRKAVMRLLGRGVIEGYWREQEELGKLMYCMAALDPAPTPEPKPLKGAVEYCRGVWRGMSVARLDPYREIVESLVQ